MVLEKNTTYIQNDTSKQSTTADALSKPEGDTLSPELKNALKLFTASIRSAWEEANIVAYKNAPEYVEEKYKVPNRCNH